MPKVIIYTTPTCPYCNNAKALLKQKGVTQITEIDISQDETQRQEMLGKSGGRRTVPQIFINDTHVGGYDDMVALDREGKLDQLLK